MNVSPHDIARVLSEALPHMQRYDEEIVVVKYGGHAMGEEDVARSFARDIVLMEQTAINPVVVHGGGPQIGEMLKRLGIESHFAGGLRVTDAATIEIVEMVLGGSINKQIVGFINAAGGKAVGLCGKDGNMVQARKVTRTVVDPDSNIEKVIDLGWSVETRVDGDMHLIVEPQSGKCDPAQLTNGVRNATRDDEVTGLGLLEHLPHGPDVVSSKAPVTLGVKVAHRQLGC